MYQIDSHKKNYSTEHLKLISNRHKQVPKVILAAFRIVLAHWLYPLYIVHIAVENNLQTQITLQHWHLLYYWFFFLFTKKSQNVHFFPSSNPKPPMWVTRTHTVYTVHRFTVIKANNAIIENYLIPLASE